MAVTADLGNQTTTDRLIYRNANGLFDDVHIAATDTGAGQIDDQRGTTA